MTHSISELGDKANAIIAKVKYVEENKNLDINTKQFMLDDIRALARDIQFGLVDINK